MPLDTVDPEEKRAPFPGCTDHDLDEAAIINATLGTTGTDQTPGSIIEETRVIMATGRDETIVMLQGTIEIIVMLQGTIDHHRLPRRLLLDIK